MASNAVSFVCVQQRAGDLADMITRVIREGLEGLVLKDIKVSCDGHALWDSLSSPWVSYHISVLK